MAKDSKGKGKAVTVPISGVENVEEFIQPSKAKAVKAVIEEDNEDEDIELDEGEDEEDDEDDDESDDEDEYEVDEKAMNRLMELLGDVDPSELGLEMEESGDEEEVVDAASDEDDEEEEEEEEEDSDDDEDDEQDLADEDDENSIQVERPSSKKSLKQEQEIAKRKQDTILERILDRFKINVPFFETQTLTCPEPLEITDVSDDLSRELQFYKLSLWAARKASQLFKDANLPFSRPNDYYAEMLKSDEHMEKIRQKLLDDSANIKASEQAKKQRHLKKFGKQVQVEKQKERERSKREMNDKVKSFRKKRKAGDEGGEGGGEFDIGVLDEDSRPSKVARGGSSSRGGASGRGKTRSQRDTKFGRPTTSRRPKENDRESTNSFGGGRGGGRGGRGGRGGGRGGGSMSRGGGRSGGGAAKQKRPGKSKRQ